MIMVTTFIFALVFYFYINAVGAYGTIDKTQVLQIGHTWSKQKQSKVFSLKVSGRSNSSKASIYFISTAYFPNTCLQESILLLI